MTATAETLPATPPELERKALSWPERAEALPVSTDPEFEAAGEVLLAIKALRDEIDDHHRPVIKAAHEAHRAALAARKRLDEPLDQAEQTIKDRMAAYHDRREAERQAEARRIEAEAQARAEEARLDEAAALEAEGRTEEAEQVLEEEAPLAAVAAPPPAPKAKGVAMRETWSAEVTDLGALVRAVSAGEQPLSYLQADLRALNGVAKALRGELRIPGVRARRQKNVAARSR